MAVLGARLANGVGLVRPGQGVPLGVPGQEAQAQERAGQPLRPQRGVGVVRGDKDRLRAKGEEPGKEEDDYPDARDDDHRPKYLKGQAKGPRCSSTVSPC